MKNSYLICPHCKNDDGTMIEEYPGVAVLIGGCKRWVCSICSKTWVTNKDCEVVSIA